MLRRLAKRVLNPWLHYDSSGPLWLTFDDGPHENTLALLDALDEVQVRALFFVQGVEAERRPEVLAETVRRGHRLGWHGQRHVHPRELSGAALEADLARGRALLEAQGQRGPFWYRPPYGGLVPRLFPRLRRNRFRLMMWNCDSEDSERSVDEVVASLAPARLPPRPILLFHDDYAQTADTIRRLVPVWRDAGVEFALPDG